MHGYDDETKETHFNISFEDVLHIITYVEAFRIGPGYTRGFLEYANYVVLLLEL